MCRRDRSPTDAPSALDPDRLVRRLRELAGEERDVQVDFLLHLDEFDRRRAFLEEGYDSLWTYCQNVLHLREGAAGRRIGAMRVLRRFPELEAPLRDGRLCISTVTLLGPLLTPDNLPDLVARASNRTKAEVERLVVSIQPRVAPKEGLRKLPQREPELAANISPGPQRTPLWCTSDPSPSVNPPDPLMFRAPERRLEAAAAPLFAVASPPLPPASTPSSPAARRHEIRPTSADEWSLRVTLDERAKADLETLSMLLSHSTGGDLAAVLREAIRCGIEKHGKRRGAVAPTRERALSLLPANVHAEAPAAVTSGDERTAEARQPEPPPTALDAAPRGLASKTARASTDSRTPVSSPTTSRNVPPRPHRSAVPRADRRAIPIAVRREVWLRDGGCCAWTSPDGRRCGSRWKLEFDHVQPVAQGGPSTADNLRLTCRTHNVLHAELVFGREHMARFSSRGADRAEHAGTAPQRAAERYSQE